ncbi:hypothetical protein HMP0721_0239 [Pseudoramibacter alactolyticus ATCC 23263]|uniref:Uncharacterized protein n=2 Tax=Pseudoramibacter TaxID=113286 RepID=E6ME06_9FIRM|nr:hypothetical protein HMP0721_0239 [Pseudoramibacter alactolyticus ATCC 23263]
MNLVKIKGVQAMKKTRKTRGDCTVGSFEKKHGLSAGTIRNKDGRDTRSDKKIETIRKELERGKY